MKGADLLVGNTLGMKRRIGDRGYDANRLRAVLREQGAIPVIQCRCKASDQSIVTNSDTATGGRVE
jgi:hypothetical protein